MTSLTFLTLLWVAGLVAWLTDRHWPWTDTALAVPAVIIAGLGAGLFIGAWT